MLLIAQLSDLCYVLLHFPLGEVSLIEKKDKNIVAPSTYRHIHIMSGQQY